MSVHTDFLPIKVPVIQAPMAGCQNQVMTMAVSRAGALGSLPAATLNPDELESALLELEASGLPYNVNFFAHAEHQPDASLWRKWIARLQPFYDEMGLTETPRPQAGRRAFDGMTAEVLSRFRPAVVSFHFGLPHRQLLSRVRATGARIVSSATTLIEGLYLQSQGVDAVIAQGLEAGGHRGHFLSTDLSLQSSLEDLLTDLVSNVSVPVIAAGGLGQPQRIERALDRGAIAAQVGTAFLLCNEARITGLHQARLRDESEATVLTNLFTGGVARGFPNRLTRELGSLCTDAPPFPWATAALAPLKQWAQAQNRDDFSSMWSGVRTGALPTGSAEQVVAHLWGSRDTSQSYLGQTHD
jgi:nitronate monooxygenase